MLNEVDKAISYDEVNLYEYTIFLLTNKPHIVKAVREVDDLKKDIIFEASGDVENFVSTDRNISVTQDGLKRNYDQGSMINITDPKDINIITRQDFLTTYRIKEGTFDNVDHTMGLPIEETSEETVYNIDVNSHKGIPKK